MEDPKVSKKILADQQGLSRLAIIVIAAILSAFVLIGLFIATTSSGKDDITEPGKSADTLVTTELSVKFPQKVTNTEAASAQNFISTKFSRDYGDVEAFFAVGGILNATTSRIGSFSVEDVIVDGFTIKTVYHDIRPAKGQESLTDIRYFIESETGQTLSGIERYFSFTITLTSSKVPTDEQIEEFQKEATEILNSVQIKNK